MATPQKVLADQIGAQDQATAVKGNRNIFGSNVKESGAGDLIYNAGMNQGDFAAMLSSFGSIFQPAQASSSGGSAPASLPTTGTATTAAAATVTDKKNQWFKWALVIAGGILAVILFKKFFK